MVENSNRDRYPCAQERLRFLVITIDADSLSISVDVSDAEMAKRKEAWVAPPLKYTRGTMYRYIKTVSSAMKGCVTDE